MNEQQDASSPKLSKMALLSILFGFLSLCLGIVAAIPAIVFAILAFREIGRCRNRVTGTSLGVVGLVSKIQAF